MFVDLTSYAHLKICVAVSGGKDSMALLHYLSSHCGEYSITLSALNCDHGIRANSASDSLFVKEWCKAHNIPLTCFKADGFASEEKAREWRLDCYLKALEKGENRQGADVVATAHHLNDNAETVLFNLARGSSLTGLTGITDCFVRGGKLRLIRPFISCSRGDIDGYIAQNDIPFVTDESNFSDTYTRNKIRHSVLPALEDAVDGAAKAIFRFSRLAADDEEYFSRQISTLINASDNAYIISHCGEKVIFRRAAAEVVGRRFCRKDYTLLQMDKLFELQFAPVGKRYEFLGLTAFKEEGRIAIADNAQLSDNGEEVPLGDFLSGARRSLGGQPLMIILAAKNAEQVGEKVLRLDIDRLPENCVVRFKREGDRFKKFGGGEKSLGDYFTDIKLPLRLRGRVPLIAKGSEVFAVCGVEISDNVKVTKETKNIGYIAGKDFAALIKKI